MEKVKPNTRVGPARVAEHTCPKAAPRPPASRSKALGKAGSDRARQPGARSPGAPPVPPLTAPRALAASSSRSSLPRRAHRSRSRASSSRSCASASSIAAAPERGTARGKPGRATRKEPRGGPERAGRAGWVLRDPGTPAPGKKRSRLPCSSHRKETEKGSDSVRAGGEANSQVGLCQPSARGCELSSGRPKTSRLLKDLPAKRFLIHLVPRDLFLCVRANRPPATNPNGQRGPRAGAQLPAAPTCPCPQKHPKPSTQLCPRRVLTKHCHYAENPLRLGLNTFPLAFTAVLWIRLPGFTILHQLLPVWKTINKTKARHQSAARLQRTV